MIFSDSGEKVYFELHDVSGQLWFVINDVTKEDIRSFSCDVPRRGQSREITLRVLGY